MGTMYSYIGLFTHSPINMAVLIACFSLAIFLLFVIRVGDFDIKRRMHLIYAHIILLILPFVFILFNKACQKQILACQNLQTYAFGIPGVLLGVLMVVIAGGYIIVPLIYRSRSKDLSLDSTSLAQSIRKQATLRGWRVPRIFALDSGKPVAFAFSQWKVSIFISVGMWELLTQKEREAVLLHELWHTNSHAGSYKLSTLASRLISPLSAFGNMANSLEREERDADDFAVKVQGTTRYLQAARKKVGNFN